MRSSRNLRRQRRIGFEPLESRLLLSATTETLQDHLALNAGAFVIYEYQDSGYNHFYPSYYEGTVQLTVKTDQPRGDDDTCIRITRPEGNNWGMLGFEEPEGFFSAGVPGGGYSILNAVAALETKLLFEARAVRASDVGDIVQFGIGDQNTDSLAIRSDCKLSADWTTFPPLDLSEENLFNLAGQDLSNVHLGFVASSGAGEFDLNNDGCVFEIDNIRIESPAIDRTDADQLPRSYITLPGSGEEFDRVLVNTSFVYDSAVTIQALLAAGELESAERLGETLLVVMQNDIVPGDNPDAFRPDGADHAGYRVHSSYMCGDALSNSTGQPRLAGFYEDSAGAFYIANHGLVCGDNAWTALAMLDLYAHTIDGKYLDAAENLAEWISTELYADDDAGGFTIGWQTDAEAHYFEQTAKSTEHNIDCYALFSALANLKWSNGDAAQAQIYDDLAAHAGDFVMSMFDDTAGRFYIGTEADGETPNTTPVILDVQTWAVLALSEGPYGDVIDWHRPIAFAQANLQTTDTLGNVGVDFGYAGEDGDTAPDGIWTEGVGQMASACRLLGWNTAADEYLQSLSAWSEPGQLHDASQSGTISTGIWLPDGQPWLYYQRRALAPTAWAAIAEAGANPFTPIASPAANTYVVDTSADVVDPADGLLSLREALAEANANLTRPADPDVITFAASLDGETLLLGGTELIVEDPVVIEGLGSDSLTIDADGKSRVFSIQGGVSAEISGLTLTGGSADYGGAILNAGNLDLREMVFSGNTATGGGGAIQNTNSLMVTGATFSDNSAPSGHGGGINNEGTVHVANTRFFGNSADFGGGVANHGEATVVNSLFADNHVSDNGGGMLNAAWTIVTVDNCTFIRNSAGWYGGGLYCYWNCDATVNNSAFWDNENTVYARGPNFYSDAQEVVRNCLFGLPDGRAGATTNSGDMEGENCLWGYAPRFVRNPGINSEDDLGDLRLRDLSAAVDAGDATLLPADIHDLDADGDVSEPVPVDLLGAPRVQRAELDIGCYEGGVFVSIIGDLTDDGIVGSDDLDIIRANWGQIVAKGSLQHGDLSGDGRVNSDDLDIIRANWGATTSAAATAQSDSDGASYSGRTGEDDAAKRDFTARNRQAIADALWTRTADALNDHNSARIPRVAHRVAVDLVFGDWG